MKHVNHISTYRPCKHLNGWYGSIRILGFLVRLFWCEDCHKILKLTDVYKVRKEGE